MRIFAVISLILSFIGETLWPSQLSQAELLLSFIVFIVDLIVLTVVFYVAGVVVLGKKRAKFGDAFVISIRRYYQTSWLGALAVGILAVIVMIILGFLLELLLVAIGVILPHLP